MSTGFKLFFNVCMFVPFNPRIKVKKYLIRDNYHTVFSMSSEKIHKKVKKRLDRGFGCVYIVTMKTKIDNSNLRKQVKKLMIDKDLEWSRGFLASEINCNSRSLLMALSGYRTNPASMRILKNLKSYLKGI